MLDIHVWIQYTCAAGSTEYWREISLRKTISEQYTAALQDYQTGHIDCITIIPAFHHIWNQSWNDGSVVAVAPFFDHNSYSILDVAEKKHCLLELIHGSMLRLADEYNWNKKVLEHAFIQALKAVEPD